MQSALPYTPDTTPAAPLTNAERQRRHRAKRKAEAAQAAAERSSDAVACVIYENKALRNRIEAVQLKATEIKPLREERDALRIERDLLQRRLAEARGLFRTLVARLPLAGQQLARRHLQDNGCADWLDAG